MDDERLVLRRLAEEAGLFAENRATPTEAMTLIAVLSLTLWNLLIWGGIRLF